MVRIGAMSLTRVLALIAVVGASGCATILNEDTRLVTVQSNLPGAQVVVDGRPVGPAPLTVPLTNSNEHQIMVHAPGYAPQGCFLDASVGIGWVILDVILIPLLIPIIVDAVTGEWRDLDQTNCFVTLTPMAPPAPGPAPPPAPGAY